MIALIQAGLLAAALVTWFLIYFGIVFFVGFCILKIVWLVLGFIF